jgi:hypothetical protein
MDSEKATIEMEIGRFTMPPLAPPLHSHGYSSARSLPQSTHLQVLQLRRLFTLSPERILPFQSEPKKSEGSSLPDSLPRQLDQEFLSSQRLTEPDTQKPHRVLPLRLPLPAKEQQSSASAKKPRPTAPGFDAQNLSRVSPQPTNDQGTLYSTKKPTSRLPKPDARKPPRVPPLTPYTFDPTGVNDQFATDSDGNLQRVIAQSQGSREKEISKICDWEGELIQFGISSC